MWTAKSILLQMARSNLRETEMRINTLNTSCIPIILIWSSQMRDMCVLAIYCDILWQLDMHSVLRYHWWHKFRPVGHLDIVSQWNMCLHSVRTLFYAWACCDDAWPGKFTDRYGSLGDERCLPYLIETTTERVSYIHTAPDGSRHPYCVNTVKDVLERWGTTSYQYQCILPPTEITGIQHGSACEQHRSTVFGTCDHRII